MNYTEKTKPGMMDPFYYEESVGLFYILDMLNQDNHIDYVELQGLYPLGLDDVVITYENGDKCFIQVKHTRAGDTITFGDIVSVDNSKKNEDSRCSFLSQIAKAWIQEKEQYTNSKVYIVTNRKAGEFSSTAKKNGTVKRPPLKIFLDELKEQTDKANSFSDITFSDDKEEAWREWCGQLEGIEKDEDKLYFLKNLHFKTNQEDLDELRKTIKGKIQNYFSISEEGAEVLLGKLDHALIEWTTSSRDSSKITVEKLYSALSANEDIINYNHEFISQNPFFDSRKNFVEKIESDLKNGDEKILFISGGPGTGKTNIISKLCERKEGCIDIRYHAYEPINPAKEYLPLDVSERVKKEIFWDTLLNQLRNVLKGKLYKYKVPVSNSFLTLEEKRNKFFEIASEYAKEINRDFIIAIDGIDHAARAGVVEDTFLHTMPSPDYLPKNIKIVIAGQPKEYYTTYPLWLYGNSSYIKEYKVPEIQPSDVESLVNNKCEKISNSDKNLIIEIICRYAAGNTLAAVFAVQEALNSANPQNLEESLKKRKLSGNIQEYYQRIWEDAIKRVQIPFINYKMAGIFAFFNEPITAQKLSCIFKDEPISNSSWNNILKSLSPLLIEKDGLYTIMHNDVRVYLSSLIGRDHEHVKEVYSKLADYYLSQTEKSIGYYHDSIRFLKFAGRFQEVFEVFTSEFIMNSFVNGVELVEIINTSNELMKLVISENELDWNKLLSLLCHI